MIDICYDAQTSGGLLIAIAESCAEKFLKALHREGVSAATVIGRVLGKGSGIVHIRASGGRRLPGGQRSELPPVKTGEVADAPKLWRRSDAESQRQQFNIEPKSEEVPCCADAVRSAPVTAGRPGSAGPERQPGAAEASGSAQVEAKFKDFLSSAGSPHSLDAYTKQAIAIALSVAMRCEPCLKMHLKNAKKKGFTQDEIDEAAWMGISFGGSPTMVFYEQHKNS
jgi:AhpD family alkylhydroperoxidase